MNYSVGFPGGSDSKKPLCNAGDPGSIPGSGRSPGEGNGVTHSSILARIPWTHKSMGLQRVRHDSANTFTFDDKVYFVSTIKTS